MDHNAALTGAPKPYLSAGRTPLGTSETVYQLPHMFLGRRLGAQPPANWSACAIDLDLVPRLSDSLRAGDSGTGPTAWRPSFTADQSVDHFLQTDAWGKGLAWVNGFCLAGTTARFVDSPLPGPLEL